MYNIYLYQYIMQYLYNQIDFKVWNHLFLEIWDISKCCLCTICDPGYIFLFEDMICSPQVKLILKRVGSPIKKGETCIRSILHAVLPWVYTFYVLARHLWKSNLSFSLIIFWLISIYYVIYIRRGNTIHFDRDNKSSVKNILKKDLCTFVPYIVLLSTDLLY